MSDTEPRTETFDVTVIRDFDAPVERLWQAWTEPDDLRVWWGPAGFECTRATVDVREGGRIFVTMKAPPEYGGFESHSTWNITRVEPQRSIRYVFNFADVSGNRITPEQAGIPPGVPADGEHEVHLTDVGDGLSRLEMTEHGYTTAEARDLSQRGLEECLDKMADLIDRHPGTR
jgi:uncharacterized protein YndB with AHSA1/START domain